jgi:hypothetical protein
MSLATIKCNKFSMYSARDFSPISSKLGYSRQIYIKEPNIKFDGNPSSGSRADTCGHKWVDTGARMDITQVTGAISD